MRPPVSALTASYVVAVRLYIEFKPLSPVRQYAHGVLPVRLGLGSPHPLTLAAIVGSKPVLDTVFARQVAYDLKPDVELDFRSMGTAALLSGSQEGRIGQLGEADPV
jgi:hypothetical protein